MLNLSNVILVAFGSKKIEETIKAIQHCQKLATFYESIYLTDFNIQEQNIRHIKTRNIPSLRDYQEFIVKESPDLILSNINKNFNGHFLCINWDGFIVNPNAWSPTFLEYDYIGAPWPEYNYKVGNGGFCLKSIKFILLQQKICKNYNVQANEDIELCINLRKQFEDYNCKYAPTEIGFKFSTEIGEYDKYNSFGFHDFRHQPQFLKFIK